MRSVKRRDAGIAPIANRRARGRRLLLLAACATLSAPGPLLAATHTYIGASGTDWNTAGDWSPTGVPVGGDTALVEPSSAKTITYDGTYTSGNPLADLTLGGISTTLNQTSGTLYVTSDNIDSGTFSQSAGFEDVQGTLTLGLDESSGTLILSAGSLTSANTQLGSQSGLGDFIQNGSTSTSNLGTLTLGNSGAPDEAAADGSITLSAGTLVANNTAVGYDAGAGTFTQNGSLSVSSLGTLTVGDGGAGTVVLSAGTLTATSTSVGSLGDAGTFEQNGSLSFSSLGTFTLGSGTGSGFGSLTAGFLNAKATLIGDGSAGIFAQNGGSSGLGTLIVGAGVSGTVLLSGGTLDVVNSVGTDSCEIGSNGSSGTFNQTGGVSSLGTLLIGVGANSSGTVLLSAGSLTAGANPFATGAIVGDGGTALFSQSGGSSSISNLTVGAISSGTVSLTGGTLTVTNSTVIGDGGTGTFVQNGSLAVSNLAGAAIGIGSSGTLILEQGSLTAGNTYVGGNGLSSGGSGFFFQNGGSSSLGALNVGDGAPGYAQLTGGTLGATNMVLGTSNAGTFSQGSGVTTANFGSVIIGEGAAGSLNLSQGTLNVTNQMFIADGSAGTFNQSGSLSNSSFGNIVVGIASTTGTVLLSGGSLSSPEMLLGYTGPGQFQQNGGSSSLGSLFIGYGSGATGTVSVSAGTLTAAQTTVGSSGAGTFIVDLDSVSLGAVQVTSNGTIESNGGTINVQTLNNGGFIGCDGEYYNLFITGGGSLNGTPLESGSVSVDNIDSEIMQTGGVSYLGAVTLGGFGGGDAGFNNGDISISGGSFNASTVAVGVSSGSEGTLSQSDGSSSLGTLNVGVGGNALGIVFLTGGSLTASSTAVGDGTASGGNGTIICSGVFSQSGGSSSLGALTVGVGGNGSGAVSLTSGTLAASSTVVGAGGVGTFGQSGTQSFSSLGTVTVSSTGTLALAGGTMDVQKITSAGTISITGGTLAITNAGSLGTGSINGVSISGPGVLDVGSSGLVIEYGNGTSPVGDIAIPNGLNPSQTRTFVSTARNYPANSLQRYAQTGINGLNWNGTGIISSFAENDPTGLTAVGIVDENDLGIYPSDYTVAGGGTGTWMGQPINDTNNVLVRMTWYGDGNLDGVVNRFDVTALAQGYSGLAGYIGWSDGDYQYAGDITKNDVSLLAASYVFQGAPLGDAITPAQAQYLLALDPDMPANVQAEFDAIAAGQTPEPTGAALVGVAVVGVLRGRRRRLRA